VTALSQDYLSVKADELFGQGMILSGLMDSHKEKAYQTTTGYNRNMIRFNKNEE